MEEEKNSVSLGSNPNPTATLAYLPFGSIAWRHGAALCHTIVLIARERRAAGGWITPANDMSSVNLVPGVRGAFRARFPCPYPCPRSNDAQSVRGLYDLCSERQAQLMARTILGGNKEIMANQRGRKVAGR